MTRPSWSFLRLALAVWVLVAGGSCLLEQATGEQTQEVARSLGVSDVNDWDIRSLYRVRFQHVTKRPPPGQRHAERKSVLATRWAALRERITDLLPSRHTNPRTVVTFDRIATDFVNVGIVKLAKVLDPPKPGPSKGPSGRHGRKGKALVTLESTPSTTVPTTEVTNPEPGEHESPSTKPSSSRTDARPKRRVTLLVDLPDLDVDEDAVFEDRSTKLGLPEVPMKLVADQPCPSTGVIAQRSFPMLLVLSIATTVSFWRGVRVVLRM